MTTPGAPAPSLGIWGFRNQLLPFFQAGNVILNKQGLFVYDGKPGPFTPLLFTSVGSGANQTDKFGNKILPNTTMYTGGTTAINVIGGTISWWNGSFAAGWNPATQFVQQNGFGSPALDVSGNPVNLSVALVMAGNSNPTRHGFALAEFQGDIFLWASVLATMLHTQTSGDTNDRFAMDSNGKMNWGTGAAATDTDLYRTGVNFLETDGQFLAQGNLQTFSALQALVAAGTTPAIAISSLLAANARFFIDGNGKLNWGSGGASAVDTDLYRLTAGYLATDDILALGNQAAGIPASQTGFSLLWSDSFGQVHTDKAVVSEVNFEGKNQVAPPGPGGSGAKFYTTSGYGQVRSAQTAIGGDTLSYDVGQLSLWLAADTATLANTAATNIPGLATKTVQANTYKIRAVITTKCVGAAAGTVTVNLAGPAVSAGGMSGSAIDNSNVNNVNSTAGLGSLGQAMTNIGRSTKFVFEGVVTFSAAGTLSVQARTSAAADTYLVQAGSYWELIPVTAT